MNILKLFYFIFWKLFLKQIKEPKIDDGAFGFVSSYMFSGILRSCIAVLIYDPEKKRSFMIHISSITPLKDLITLGLRHLGPRDNLRVIVGGNSISLEDSPKCRDVSTKKREAALGILSQFFTADQICVSWAPEDHVSKLLVNNKTGRYRWKFINENPYRVRWLRQIPHYLYLTFIESKNIIDWIFD